MEQQHVNVDGKLFWQDLGLSVEFPMLKILVANGTTYQIEKMDYERGIDTLDHLDLALGEFIEVEGCPAPRDKDCYLFQRFKIVRINTISRFATSMWLDLLLKAKPADYPCLLWAELTNACPIAEPIELYWWQISCQNKNEYLVQPKFCYFFIFGLVPYDLLPEGSRVYPSRVAWIRHTIVVVPQPLLVLPTYNHTKVIYIRTEQELYEFANKYNIAI